MNSDTALPEGAAGGGTGSDAFQMLPLRTEDNSTDGLQCSELGASEQGPCWPTCAMNRSDLHVRHYIPTSAWPEA